jgi:hypothetical protein
VAVPPLDGVVPTVEDESDPAGPHAATTIARPATAQQAPNNPGRRLLPRILASRIATPPRMRNRRPSPSETGHRRSVTAMLL